MHIIIVTGMSGSGKSVVVNSLEDYGYFCIDNLPVHLLGEIVSKLSGTQERSGLGIEKLAVVVDSRSMEHFSGVNEGLEQLQREQIPYQILYLDASDDVLISRYKQTRRSHPMGNKAGTLDGIQRERTLLKPLRDAADIIISTDQLRPKDLAEKIFHLATGDADDTMKINIIVQSFGFKYGAPEDTDIITDVRFLPNPFYIEELRPLSGQDKGIKDYVDSFPETQKFLDKQMDLLLYLMPFYIREGKMTLTISVGCTGGRHRSVFLAERIAKRLRQDNYSVTVVHRDIAKDLQKS